MKNVYLLIPTNYELLFTRMIQFARITFDLLSIVLLLTLFTMSIHTIYKMKVPNLLVDIIQVSLFVLIPTFLLTMFIIGMILLVF